MNSSLLGLWSQISCIFFSGYIIVRFFTLLLKSSLCIAKYLPVFTESCCISEFAAHLVSRDGDEVSQKIENIMHQIEELLIENGSELHDSEISKLLMNMPPNCREQLYGQWAVMLRNQVKMGGVYIYIYHYDSVYLYFPFWLLCNQAPTLLMKDGYSLELSLILLPFLTYIPDITVIICLWQIFILCLNINILTITSFLGRYRMS